MHRLIAVILAISALATAVSIPIRQVPIVQQPQEDVETSGFRIPTMHESAIMARRMLHKEGFGTISTIFPASPPSDGSVTPLEDRPSDVEGKPFGLFEYIADCEPDTGNPTILAVDITTTFKNSEAGSNATMSLEWHPPAWKEGSYSPARLPRFSLVGYLEDMEEDTVEGKKIQECFLDKHTDVFWTPGNDIHTSHWVRFVVQEIYWFGGFGDRAKIGWIPLDEYKSVTTKEVKDCRLQGDVGESSGHRNTCPSNY